MQYPRTKILSLIGGPHPGHENSLKIFSVVRIQRTAEADSCSTVGQRVDFFDRQVLQPHLCPDLSWIWRGGGLWIAGRDLHFKEPHVTDKMDGGRTNPAIARKPAEAFKRNSQLPQKILGVPSNTPVVV